MRGLTIGVVVLWMCACGGGGADPGPDAEPLCEGCTAYVCGDGVVEGPEQCDGTGSNCNWFGFYGDDEVPCTDECTYDLTGCTGYCGDDVLDTQEQCDGGELDGRDCSDFGFYDASGLSCDAACRFDISSCTGFCGDAVVEGPEQCEGTDLGGLDCTDLGFYEPDGLACNALCGFDTSACQGFCGNGVLDGFEECDGDVGGATCLDFGYYQPDGLGCTPACAFDTTACTGYCGDKALNGDEWCEGVAPGAVSCEQFGYGGGEVGCAPGCFPSFDRCRVGPCAGTEVTCGDSIDDDCDGDLDCADADCAADGFCTGGGWCGGAIALACDSSAIGTTSGENSYVDAYACAPFEEHGREVFYEVVPTSSGPVTVTLIGAADLDLIVLDDTCDPDEGCVDASAIAFEVDSVTFDAQAGTSYYLVVDGYANQAGSFNLAVDCP